MQVAINFGFVSDWLRKFYGPIIKLRKVQTSAISYKFLTVSLLKSFTKATSPSLGLEKEQQTECTEEWPCSLLCW